MTQKLRVWHIPQVPMKAFHVETDSLQEAVKIKNALADYDLFQYENNVKGNYANANGFIYNQSVCLKIYLPDGKPAAVAVETGKAFCLSASTFVKPINLEAYYL